MFPTGFTFRYCGVCEVCHGLCKSRQQNMTSRQCWGSNPLHITNDFSWIIMELLHWLLFGNKQFHKKIQFTLLQINFMNKKSSLQSCFWITVTSEVFMRGWSCLFFGTRISVQMFLWMWFDFFWQITLRVSEFSFCAYALVQHTHM